MQGVIHGFASGDPSSIGGAGKTTALDILGSSLLVWCSALGKFDGPNLSTKVDGAAIDTAYDLTGGGRHATGVGSARLTYVAAAFGGRGGMRAVAGASFMGNASALLSGDAAHSIVVVAQANATGTALGGFAAVGQNTAGSLATSTVGVSSGAWWYGGDDSVLTGGTADLTPHVFVKTYAGSGGAASLYVDGALVASSTPGAMALSAGYCIASYLNAIAGSASVDIGDVLIVQGALTSDRRAAIRSYLKDLYGTP